MDKDLTGKTILVTGATDGIGKAAVTNFAQRGATLALVGRNPEKSRAVVDELKRSTGNKDIELFLADLSKLADGRELAQKIKAKYRKLDVLVNNAGGVFQTYQVSADGFEMTFALNHLGYFYLTQQLMELLQATPRARVVNTSSAAHKGAKFDLTNIAKSEGGYSLLRAYANSKLANILFTRELARRLGASGVTTNCFHPGFVRSGFGSNSKPAFATFIKVAAAAFARTPEKGAETLIWLATSADAGAHSGDYFFDKKVASTTPLAKDRSLATKLWTLSEQLCR